MIKNATVDPETRRVVAEVAQQAQAYLELEQGMATPGVPRVAVASVAAPGPRAPEAARPTRSQEIQPAPPGGSGAVGGPGTDAVTQLQVLAEAARGCSDCGLHAERTQAVFARGNPAADICFVGEGPGQQEDLQGLPFVGPAGQLLDRMVAAMGYGRDDVYVCNVVKCRPPRNRTPRGPEALACARFLKPQLGLVAPRVIVALGRCAAEHLGVAPAEGAWRGRWGRYEGIPTMPTYHPAYLLRSPEFKRVVWEDLQRVMTELGKPVPGRAR